MKKLLQMTLVSAIFATSGSAETQYDGGTISGIGEIEEKAIMEMDANILTKMDNYAIIHNYSIIQGPESGDIKADTVIGESNKYDVRRMDNSTKAVIQGDTKEKIINYDHIMEEDSAFNGLPDFKVSTLTYYRPTGLL